MVKDSSLRGSDKKSWALMMVEQISARSFLAVEVGREILKLVANAFLLFCCENFRLVSEVDALSYASQHSPESPLPLLMGELSLP